MEITDLDSSRLVFLMLITFIFIVAEKIRVLALSDSGESSSVRACAFPISGTYGTIPRYTYYSLQAIGTASTIVGVDSLVTSVCSGITLSYSFAAAIHSIALFISWKQHTIDLDIYPVFCITLLEMVCYISTKVSWGHKVSRVMVALFAITTFLSAVNIQRVSASPDDSPCDSILAMRKGQAAIPTEINMTHLVIALSVTPMLFWIAPVSIFATIARTALRGPAGGFFNLEYWLIRIFIVITVTCLVLFPIILSFLTIFTEILTARLPLSESHSAIGQWGPVLGVLVAIILPTIGQFSGFRVGLKGLMSNLRGQVSVYLFYLIFIPLSLWLLVKLAFFTVYGLAHLPRWVLIVPFLLYVFDRPLYFVYRSVIGMLKAPVPVTASEHAQSSVFIESLRAMEMQPGDTSGVHSQGGSMSEDHSTLVLPPTTPPVQDV